MPITPNHWGEPKWLGIHVTCYYIDVVFGKNLERQQMLHNWLELSAYMLPCSNCENHFLAFQKHNPLPEIKEYQPGETPYLRWSIRAHNAVRKRQGKALADEDLVVLTYKSGTIYGTKHHSAPKSRTQLAASDPPSSELAGYKIATYVLGALSGLFVLAGLIYLISRLFTRKPVPELSD